MTRSNAGPQQSEARLKPPLNEPDGIIYNEAEGAHFLVVSKSGSRLTFMLVEQSNPSYRVIQSEIDLDEPLQLVDPYAQAMTLGLMWDPAPNRIYVAGLGGGRLPMVLHHHIPNAVIDCVEIDPGVVDMASNFFGFETDIRLRIEIEDGRRWLEKNQEPYDLMLIDVFLDNGYTPYRMTTAEFYQLCRSRLRPRGVIAVNILASDRFVTSKLSTIRSVFDYAYVCAVQDESYVILASMVPPAAHLRYGDIAAEIKQKYRLNFPFVIHAEALTRHPSFLNVDCEEQDILADASPPGGYFDNLPALDSDDAQSRVAPDLPCPCGSGERFADCHGYSAAG